MATSPTPGQWAAARHAFNAAMTNPAENHQQAILALGGLIATFYGHGSQPTEATCGHCDAAITPTVSGTNWVDPEGWDICEGTGLNHEPAIGRA
jgi:hypothetical protein